MKRFVKLIFFLMIAITVILSCEKNDINTDDVPSQRVIYTSTQTTGNIIRVNASVTFGDVSPGVVSRLWTFPEGSSVNESAEDVVTPIFTEVGEQTINLQQVFKENAFANGALRGTEIDTTITITVLDSIRTTLKANILDSDGNLGDELTIEKDAKNQIPAGSVVRYTIEATGQPQRIEWTAEGGSPEAQTGQALEFDVTYRRLGTYDLSTNSSTQNPFDEDDLAYENLIEVIPSTEPVVLEQVKGGIDDGSLSLVFSREMDPATIQTDQFSVSIMHDGAMIPSAIDDITVDSNEGNILNISLVGGELVYTDDVVTVSYTAGTLTTTDFVAATSFSDQPIDFGNVNLYEAGGMDFGFETSVDDSNWPYQGWGPPFDGYTFSISSAQAHSGNQSALVEMDPLKGMIIGHSDGTFAVQAGKTYEVGVWVFVESLGSTPPTNLQPDIRFYWSENTDWGVGPNPEFNSSFPVNQWVFSSITVTISADSDAQNLWIRGFNEFNPEPMRFFMDDISFRQINRRP